MHNQFSRTALLLGDQAIDMLASKKIAIFGVGGVGGYAVEGLARSGVGTFELIDNDTVSMTNINRQIIATLSTVGRLKVDVAAERIHDINEEAQVIRRPVFYLKERADDFAWDSYDYVVDALDTVAAKISIIEECTNRHIPIISAMGAGNKLDPSLLSITDIYKTSMDPLARVMRYELRKRHIRQLKVCASTEKPIKPQYNDQSEEKSPGHYAPGSISFVPSVAGLMIAGEIIRDLAWNKTER